MLVPTYYSEHAGPVINVTHHWAKQTRVCVCVGKHFPSLAQRKQANTGRHTNTNTLIKPIHTSYWIHQHQMEPRRDGRRAAWFQPQVFISTN